MIDCLFLAYAGAAEDAIPSFENIPLPAKLQARGDSADPTPVHISSRSGKVIKRAKRPAFPAPLLSRPGPPPEHTAFYSGDPEISLDTNLDSMEGIVNMEVMSNSPRHSSFSSSVFSASDAPIAGDSRPSVSLVQSLSTIGIMPLDSSSPAHYRRRPSIPLSLMRKSSLDPAGGLAFPILTEAASYRVVRQASIAAGAMASDINTPLPRSSSIDAIGSYDNVNVSAARNLSNASSYDQFLGSSEIDRRPSAVTVGSTVASSGFNSIVLKDSAAAWTAPDSWAVKGGAAIEHETTSEEDDPDDDDEEEEEIDGTVESTEGPQVDTDQEMEVIGNAFAQGARGSATGILNAGADVVLPGNKSFASTGRPSTKSGRPGTADARLNGKNVRNHSSEALSSAYVLINLCNSLCFESFALILPSQLYPFLLVYQRPNCKRCWRGSLR